MLAFAVRGPPICSFVEEFGFAICLVTAYFKWCHILQMNLVMLLVWLLHISNVVTMLVQVTFVQRNTVVVCI